MTQIKFITFILIATFFLGPTGLSAKDVFQDIVIRPGDTLWSIANKYLKDPKKWTEIVKHNNLPTSDPTMALPGTRIKVPILLIKEEYRKAHLIKMIPEVRYKRKGTQEWKEAGSDMTLHYEDSLRTMKGAQAHVRFPSKEVVRINENTYVVLKPEKILQQIELLKGEVRASRAKVIMPHGTVVNPKGRNSDYQAKVREDDTEVVFVYKGKVDVTAKGKTVTVSEGFGTEVPKFSAPKDPIPLTKFKDFNPAEMTAYNPPKPKVTNSIIKSPVAKDIERKSSRKSKSIASKNILVNYTVQIARDDKFQDIVHEATEKIGSDFDINKTPIADGNYHMRVAFLDAFGVTGEFSEPSVISKDTNAPVFSNIFPKEGQKFYGDESYCDVIGVVKGAAMVAVNEEVVFVSATGRFTRFTPLAEGPNKIDIVARDIHGNETKVSRTIYYSPKKK